jgi:hypothetical protein
VRAHTNTRRCLSWAATVAERVAPLPGDELIASPLLQTTHTVDIGAPPGRVWPWLVQIGQGRAGFYADSWWWDRCVDLYYRALSSHRRHRTPSRDPEPVRVDRFGVHHGDSAPPSGVNPVCHQAARGRSGADLAGSGVGRLCAGTHPMKVRYSPTSAMAMKPTRHQVTASTAVLANDR